jgi:hypothetical protein
VRSGFAGGIVDDLYEKSCEIDLVSAAAAATTSFGMRLDKDRRGREIGYFFNMVANAHFDVAFVRIISSSSV